MVEEASITAAVAHIHQLVGSGDVSPEATSELARAFNAVDYLDCFEPGDALALLSLSNLILKEVVESQRENFEASGAGQLLVFAWAYLGRALQDLEMRAKAEQVASGAWEM